MESISSKKEIDWYKFQAPTTGAYTILAQTPSRSSALDPVLGVYNSQGQRVAFNDDIASNNRDSGVTVALTAGATYYIGITNYTGSKPGDYTYSITRPAGTTGQKVLYLNFDGASISRTELARWAGTDWAVMVNEFDSGSDGIIVQRFLQDVSASARDAVISQIVDYLTADLAPFGITVQRVTGGAAENLGGTTLFFGRSNLSYGYAHVAGDIDIGNNNRTDIAFVYDEYWDHMGDGIFSVNDTALALADVALHEAGHTYGLWHVQSGSALETMGLRYSISNQSFWVQNTSYLDQTFNEYVDSRRNGHGPTSGPDPQNSYRSMFNVFGVAPDYAPPTGSILRYLSEELYSFGHDHHDADDAALARRLAGAPKDGGAIGTDLARSIPAPLSGQALAQLRAEPGEAIQGPSQSGKIVAAAGSTLPAAFRSASAAAPRPSTLLSSARASGQPDQAGEFETATGALPDHATTIRELPVFELAAQPHIASPLAEQLVPIEHATTAALVWFEETRERPAATSGLLALSLTLLGGAAVVGSEVRRERREATGLR
ncbi:MAG: hypothetical protein JNM56_29100 [Planctomycetia bacterium]|nr:hypothetical protein [Planctomycetia bacterium]